MKTIADIDPVAVINAAKIPLDPNRSQPFPDRVIEEHNRAMNDPDYRRPEEQNRSSTYYPFKTKHPKGTA